MTSTVAQKLKIKEGYTLKTFHAPANFVEQLQPLPMNVIVAESADNVNQIHWFVTNKAQLNKEMHQVLKLVKAEIVCWIYYPKGTSKIQTDLTRDKGWEDLLEHKELSWLSLISFNETWSAFGFRQKTEADKTKEAKPKVREIFSYIDAANKTINLPDDLDEILKANKIESDFFQTLSFTNKKEYVEWIVTAKRKETRTERIKGTIDRLQKGWKNPRNL